MGINKKKFRRRMALICIIAIAAVCGYKFIQKQNNELNIQVMAKDDNTDSDAAANKANEEENKKKQEEEDKAKVSQRTSNIDNQIKQYLGQDLSKVGLVYYDINSGSKVAINENKVFMAASTVKVGMNMIAYDWVKSGKLSLDEKIQYTSSDYEEGTGRLLADFSKSKPIPVQTLLDYSILYSDNIATNMIMRKLGGTAAVRQMVNEKLGTNVDTSKNYITPEEEFRILKTIYDSKSDSNYSHLLDTMKKTIFHDRIDKDIPQDKVAHKIGNYASYVNDVGIIFTDGPYILVVYTNELPKADDKIAEISKIIYDLQSQN